MREIVKGGLYRHFKGMYYYVLGCCNSLGDELNSL